MLPIAMFFVAFVVLGSPRSQTFHYVEETFKLAINESKVLFLFGPWGDADDSIAIDKPVSAVWGSAGQMGVMVVYQKRDEIDWGLYNRETGAKKANGVLLADLEPEQGRIDYVVTLTGDERATVKIVFDTEQFMVYQVDKAGRQKLLRQGRLEKR